MAAYKKQSDAWKQGYCDAMDEEGYDNSFEEASERSEYDAGYSQGESDKYNEIDQREVKHKKRLGFF